MTEKEVLETISEVLRIAPKDLSPDMGLGREPGWDSLANVEILQRLEDRSKLRLGIEETFYLETVADYVDAFKD